MTIYDVDIGALGGGSAGLDRYRGSAMDRHPLYGQLTAAADGDGHTGDVRWNFEKFLVAPDGTVAGRFPPQTDPQDDELTAAVEKLLPR